MFTKFYRHAYGDVKNGNLDITKELERVKKSIKIASRCGFVYSGLTCVTCCLCFVKPCCLIAFDENERYKKLKHTLAKCRTIYGEDWNDAKKMNTLFIRSMEVIEAAIFQLQLQKQKLQNTLDQLTSAYASDPTDQEVKHKINDVKNSIEQIHLMSIDDDGFVHHLFKYVLRHHNPSTDMLRSYFPITINHYDMTLLRASVPILSLAFDRKYMLRVDDIIAIDTRAAYRLVSI